MGRNYPGGLFKTQAGRARAEGPGLGALPWGSGLTEPLGAPCHLASFVAPRVALECSRGTKAAGLAAWLPSLLWPVHLCG